MVRARSHSRRGTDRQQLSFVHLHHRADTHQRRRQRSPIPCPADGGQGAGAHPAHAPAGQCPFAGPPARPPHTDYRQHPCGLSEPRWAHHVVSARGQSPLATGALRPGMIQQSRQFGVLHIPNCLAFLADRETIVRQARRQNVKNTTVRRLSLSKIRQRLVYPPALPSWQNRANRWIACSLAVMDDRPWTIDYRPIQPITPLTSTCPTCAKSRERQELHTSRPRMCRGETSRPEGGGSYNPNAEIMYISWKKVICICLFFLSATIGIQTRADDCTAGTIGDISYECWNSIDQECCENGDVICVVITLPDPPQA